MIEVLGLAGIILFFAGLHVLWQSREEVLYWLHKFLETFQNSLRTTAGLGSTSSGANSSRPKPVRPSGGPVRFLDSGGVHRTPETGEPTERGAQQIHAMRMMSAFGLLLLGPLLVLLSLFLSL